MSEFREAKPRIRLSPGESVRIVREMQELSQNQLAKASGIPQSTLSAIERGRVNLGVEYFLKQFEPRLRLAMRGGYRFNRDEEGLTAGFGVEFPFVPIGFEMKPSRCNLDYCYGDMGRLGGIHKISLGLAY